MPKKEREEYLKEYIKQSGSWQFASFILGVILIYLGFLGLVIGVVDNDFEIAVYVLVVFILSIALISPLAYYNVRLHKFKKKYLK